MNIDKERVIPLQQMMKRQPSQEGCRALLRYTSTTPRIPKKLRTQGILRSCEKHRLHFLPVKSNIMLCTYSARFVFNIMLWAKRGLCSYFAPNHNKNDHRSPPPIRQPHHHNCLRLLRFKLKQKLLLHYITLLKTLSWSDIFKEEQNNIGLSSKVDIY